MPRAILVLALSVAANSSASAERPDADATPRGTYTGSLMLADGLSIASFATGFTIARSYEDCDCEEFGSGYLMMFGLIGYAASGPAVHAHHDRHGRAWTSGLLRVGLPVISGSIAYGATRSPGQTAGWAGAGALAAMMIDWAVLARPSEGGDRTSRVGLYLAPTSHGALAGAAGRW